MSSYLSQLNEGDIIECIVVPQCLSYSNVYIDNDGDLFFVGVVQQDDWAWMGKELLPSQVTKQNLVLYYAYEKVGIFSKKHAMEIPEPILDKWWKSLTPIQKMCIYEN